MTADFVTETALFIIASQYILVAGGLDSSLPETATQHTVSHAKQHYSPHVFSRLEAELQNCVKLYIHIAWCFHVSLM